MSRWPLPCPSADVTWVVRVKAAWVVYWSSLHDCQAYRISGSTVLAYRGTIYVCIYSAAIAIPNHIYTWLLLVGISC